VARLIPLIFTEFSFVREGVICGLFARRDFSNTAGFYHVSSTPVEEARFLNRTYQETSGRKTIIFIILILSGL